MKIGFVRRSDFFGLLLSSALLALLVFNVTILPYMVRAAAQPIVGPLRVKNLTTREDLTNFQSLTLSDSSLPAAGPNNSSTTLTYSDRQGRLDSNGDWNVLMRIKHSSSENSTRGIELGSDSILVENTTLPISNEVTILRGSSSHNSSNIPEKIREQLPSSQPDIALSKAVSDFINTSLVLEDSNSNNLLTHYVVLQSNEDKYAEKQLNVKGQFVTTLAFYEKYVSTSNKGELDIFVQISHFDDRVNSLRAAQLGNANVKISINGEDQGNIKKAIEIGNTSSQRGPIIHQSITASSPKASGIFRLNFTANLSQPTSDQIEERSEKLESIDLYVPTPSVGTGELRANAIHGPTPSTRSDASTAGNVSTSANSSLNITRTSFSPGNYGLLPLVTPQEAFADGDPSKSNVYRVSGMPVTSSSVAEPSVANKNNIVFYTSNWMAARSEDNGRNWKFANPNDMPTFCCDQDVIYHDVYGVFIWYRQGSADINGENSFRLSISKDAVNWIWYDFQPKDVDSKWTNRWFDYPHLALSQNSLWITSNMFDNSSPPKFKGAAALEMPLDALSTGAGFTYNVYPVGDFSPTPVQGASDTMYIGAHASNVDFTIYSIKERSGTYTQFYRYIDGYNVGYPQGTGETAADAAGHVMSCPGPDGYNWCSRSDDRITNGWTSAGYVGFFWNALQGTTSYCSALEYEGLFPFNPYSISCPYYHSDNFPYPYVDGAVFDLSDDLKYVAKPVIWSPDHAWSYGSASPNVNLLGMAAFYGGGKYYPGENVAIQAVKDPSSSEPLSSGWSFSAVADSSGGPKDSLWGDYIRVRPYAEPDDPSNHLWIASAFTYNTNDPSPGRDSVRTYYVIFGREADAPAKDLSIKITSPENGYTVTSYSPVTLTADAALPGHSLPDNAITWSSNTEGFLGNGKSITHVFRYAKDGPQTVTATVAYDYPPMSASDSVTLNMKFPHHAPTPVILEPKSGLNVATGATVFLKGYATRADPEQNGNLGWTDCTRMKWLVIETELPESPTSSVPSTKDSNFELNGLCNAEVSFSTEGSRTIRLSAANSVGDIGHTDVIVNVVNTSTSSFDVSAYPESQSAYGGGKLAYHVAVTQTGGTPKPVALSVSGIPKGVTSTWQCTSGGSSPCTLPSFATDLVLTLANGAYTAGTYTITITGTDNDGTSHSVNVTLSLSYIR